MDLSVYSFLSLHMICSYHLTGNLLFKQLLLATTQAKETKADFVMFDTSLHQENLAEVLKIEKAIALW